MDVWQLLEFPPELHVEGPPSVQLKPGILERIELLGVQAKVLGVGMVFQELTHFVYHGLVRLGLCGVMRGCTWSRCGPHR